MRRALTLTVLLATMFLVAACGGDETQRSEQGVQPKEEQAAPTTVPATQSAPEESATSEGASQAVPQEGAQGGGDSEAASKAAGLSVTTLQGEQVSLGDQEEVTALYFMAGW